MALCRLGNTRVVFQGWRGADHRCAPLIHGNPGPRGCGSCYKDPRWGPFKWALPEDTARLVCGSLAVCQRGPDQGHEKASEFTALLADLVLSMKAQGDPRGVMGIPHTPQVAEA